MKYLSTLLATTCTRPPLLTMKMPKTALDLLPVEVTDHAIFAMAAERNWNAFRECYPSEEACIEALRINVAVVLPYGADSVSSGFYELGEAVDRSGNIAGSYAVLQEKLDGSAAVLDGEIHFVAAWGRVVLRNGAWAELADGPAREYTTCESILLG